ncbi:N-acetyltransferase [Vibrio sp. MACH09]|uniref:GNAT family N-acetyltransferase n=1 Tax=Vibrio sp. MACH09 TaxID=3025122 RepID=UPI00278E1322|nr:GNAT family N-acetyltransferase [Vibrio sp. MACH09]GLO62533.1 N-acetyltransferase [Vibrio sp. MACH09]
MLVLRQMEQEEYPAYCQYFIDDYSQEIVKNYGHSLDTAIELAKKDLYRCFPDGLDSKEHTLLCIEADINGMPRVIGYLWHAINIKAHSTFIYDFYVSDEYRGQGFGRQAIALLEEQIEADGINEIKLRVAYHNSRALKLYQECGFVITGYNMSKQLSKTP